MWNVYIWTRSAALHTESLPKRPMNTNINRNYREVRILFVHENASFRDLIRELGVPAAVHVVPAQPVFPSMDELARVASSHDLTPIGPPMSVEDADTIFAAAH